MPKWTRRSGSRRAELTRAALELFAERGVQATRVADVAERAGVTVGTVYRYFRDKDDLVEAVTGAAPIPEPPPVAARPGAILPALADALRRWRAHFGGDAARVLRVELSDPRHASGRFDSLLAVAQREIESLVREGAARRELRDDLDSAAVARALAGAIAMDAVLAHGGDQAGKQSGEPGGETGEQSEAAVAEAIAAIATRGLRPGGPSWAR